MSDTPETDAAREIAACSQCDRLALRVAHLSEALEAADECLALIEDVGHGAHMDNVTVARGIIAKAMSLDPANAKAMTPGATESPLKRNRNDIEVRSSAPCSASSARTAELRRRLVTLGNWCLSRAAGEHDEKTTLTMLRKKAEKVGIRVQKAGWLCTPECSNCGRSTRETPHYWICNNCGQRHSPQNA